MKKSLIDRGYLYLSKIRRIALTDTQAIRMKLLDQLNGLFELAMSIAKGEVKHFRGEDGKEHPVAPKQREKWARIAAYTAQVMHNLARGFDEKQFQTELNRLQEMVDEIKREQAAENHRADAQ